MNETEHYLEIRRWLQYAEEDLWAAERMLHQEDALPRHICWLAQQAAEKTLKAALVFVQVEFPAVMTWMYYAIFCLLGGRSRRSIPIWRN